MTAPVSACLIVKNEEAQIESCLKSIRPYVTEIVVVDTGSTDSTLEIARKYADRTEVFTGCNGPDGLIVDFALARQRSFDLASQPWVMWVDGDDEVQGAEHLAEIVARHDAVRAGRPSIVFFPYEYARDDRGNVVLLLERERLCSPKEAFYWKSPVHEVMSPRPGVEVLKEHSDKVRFVHRRDLKRKPVEDRRNLRILQSHYAKNGESDTRLLYYLGLEYGYIGDLGNAIKFHKRYIELADWDDERFLACIKIAEHYQVMGDLEAAVDWGTKALAVREGWAEAYFSLGKSFYFMAQRRGPNERRNWERAVHFLRHGLSLPPTKTILFVNPTEREYEVHKFLNFACSEIGDLSQALVSCNAALKVRPDDKDLHNNRLSYVQQLAMQKVNQGFAELVMTRVVKPEVPAMVADVIAGRIPVTVQPKQEVADVDAARDPSPEDVVKAVKLLWTQLLKNNEIREAKSLLQSVPRAARDDAALQALRETTDSMLVPTDAQEPVQRITQVSSLDIVLYVGRGIEPWNPATAAKQGIGGSETAVVEMSKRLVTLGHSVRVYGDCRGGIQGTFDGVRYADVSEYKNLTCDVLVTSRRPDAVDPSYAVNRRTTMCWVHDVHCGRLLTPERALKIDKFLVLSEWHKRHVLGSHPFLQPSQLVQTRNGIDLRRFDRKDSPRVRDPHRAVYSSSPDRGMEVAVRVWPRVRQRVPGAELHIFYGFQTWEAGADEGQRNLIASLQSLLRDYESCGVRFHGRVNQDKLAEEFLRSGVWAYPTWFSETSCITAMEAHAAGLRMVTSPIAALNETVGGRGVMIPGDWLSLDYQNRFVDAVVAAMNRTDDSDRERLISYAQENFGWDSLAMEWSSMFQDAALHGN